MHKCVYYTFWICKLFLKNMLLYTTLCWVMYKNVSKLWHDVKRFKGMCILFTLQCKVVESKHGHKFTTKDLFPTQPCVEANRSHPKWKKKILWDSFFCIFLGKCYVIYSVATATSLWWHLAGSEMSVRPTVWGVQLPWQHVKPFMCTQTVFSDRENERAGGVCLCVCKGPVLLHKTSSHTISHLQSNKI